MSETHETAQPEQNHPAEFEELASQPRMGVASQFLGFLLHNKKWWLIPILLVLLLLGALVMLGGTGAAPFIYTLF